MPKLKNTPTLKDFQTYVEELEGERGFTEDSVIHKCLLLGEEVGELFKAIRKGDSGSKIDPTSKVGSTEEELADIIIFICSIANRLNIDLEQAFRNKEEVNKKRTWQ